MSETRTEGVSTGRKPLIASILLGLFGGGAVLAWGLAGLLTGPDPIGDGSDPESYGIDLSNAIVEREAIISTGSPRDFLPAYLMPESLSGAEVADVNASESRKWQKNVVSGDRVIGLVIGGDIRAYPLFIVDAHEIVMDEVGGVPIVIARSPLTDEVMVYDRRLPDGTVMDFGVSGLLVDLALLMYDTGSESASLWSAHDGRAVAGPAVGARLTPVPGVSVGTWRDWLALHPETLVALRDPESMRRYRRIDYRRYLDGDDWLIPPRRTAAGADPDLPAGRDRVLTVMDTDARVLGVVPIAELQANAVAGRTRLVFGDRTMVIRPDAGASTAVVVDPGGLVTRFGMWSSVWTPDPEGAVEALERGRKSIGGDALTPPDGSA
ncbi:MAG: hypothetical protein CMJ34_14205 [Phycisphaerae bacterium]|nr:hypothetical protein [Phycisphaerae bacterium]